LVVGVQVDAFVDVNLALIGPVGTDHPTVSVSSCNEEGRWRRVQGRPGAAVAARHVGKVGDDESSVVRSLAHDTDTFTSWPIGVQRGRIVYSHVDLTSLCSKQTQLLRFLGIDVVDEAIC
jgi:hypothetical protein